LNASKVNQALGGPLLLLFFYFLFFAGGHGETGDAWWHLTGVSNLIHLCG
jgi:hypothetical protein